MLKYHIFVSSVIDSKYKLSYNSQRNHANWQSKNIQRLVKILGRSRMKIRGASEDFTEGGIQFSGPNTTYMEANA